jgi:hypothetical protein
VNRRKKESPRRSALGATPPSRPIGKVSPPAEDREPPTWGSNLLEVKFLEEEVSGREGTFLSARFQKIFRFRRGRPAFWRRSHGDPLDAPHRRFWPRDAGRRVALPDRRRRHVPGRVDAELFGRFDDGGRGNSASRVDLCREHPVCHASLPVGDAPSARQTNPAPSSSCREEAGQEGPSKDQTDARLAPSAKEEDGGGGTSSTSTCHGEEAGGEEVVVENRQEAQQTESRGAAAAAASRGGPA